MQVRFSVRASKQLKALLLNLADYHSDAVSERVEALIRTRVDGLISFPFQYEAFRSRRYGSVRRMVVAEKTVILYRVQATTITIVALYDARTNWK